MQFFNVYFSLCCLVLKLSELFTSNNLFNEFYPFFLLRICGQWIPMPSDLFAASLYSRLHLVLDWEYSRLLLRSSDCSDNNNSRSLMCANSTDPRSWWNNDYLHHQGYIFRYFFWSLFKSGSPSSNNTENCCKVPFLWIFLPTGLNTWVFVETKLTKSASTAKAN